MCGLIHKIYKRGVNIMNGANTALISASTQMGLSGVRSVACIVGSAIYKCISRGLFAKPKT